MRATKVLGVGAAAVALVVGCGDEAATMEPPGSTPLTKITVVLLDEEGKPTPTDPATTPLAAFQDEDGFWRPMLRTSESYLAEITGERYGVAIGCVEKAPPAEDPPADPGDPTEDPPEDPGGPTEGSHETVRSSSIRIVHATVSERALVALAACPRAGERVEIAMGVAATGIGENEAAVLHAGADQLELPGDGDYVFPVTPATRELFATVGTTEPLGHGMSRHAVRSVLRIKDVAPDAEPGLAIDFGVSSVPLARHRVAIGGSPVAGIVKSFLHAPDARYDLGREVDELVLAPAALVQATELPRLQFSTGYASPEQSLAYYPKAAELESAAPLALELGPPFAPQAPLLLKAPYLRPVFLFFPIEGTLEGEERSTGYFLRAADDQAARTYDISMTEGWIADASPLPYKMPDFSTLAGWTAELGIDPAAKLTFRMSRVEQSTARRIAGRLVRGSSVLGSCDEEGCKTEIPGPTTADSVELMEQVTPASPGAGDELP